MTDYIGTVKVSEEKLAAALTELGATVEWVETDYGMCVSASGVTPEIVEQLYARKLLRRPRQRKTVP